eukprot:SAG11_NODE_46_length_20454_cov_11.499386_9_plen_485_part_00
MYAQTASRHYAHAQVLCPLSVENTDVRGVWALRTSGPFLTVGVRSVRSDYILLYGTGGVAGNTTPASDFTILQQLQAAGSLTSATNVDRPEWVVAVEPLEAGVGFLAASAPHELVMESEVPRPDAAHDPEAEVLAVPHQYQRILPASSARTSWPQCAALPLSSSSSPDAFTEPHSHVQMFDLGSNVYTVGMVDGRLLITEAVGPDSDAIISCTPNVNVAPCSVLAEDGGENDLESLHGGFGGSVLIIPVLVVGFVALCSRCFGRSRHKYARVANAEDCDGESDADNGNGGGFVITNNAKILLVAIGAFGAITIAQLIGALVSNSLALLGDCASMGVDTATYVGNLVAECSVEADADIQERNQMAASFVSLTVLCAITLTVIFDALARIHQPVELAVSLGPGGIYNISAVDAAAMEEAEEAEVDPYIVCGFALAGLLLDCSTFAAFRYWGAHAAAHQPSPVCFHFHPPPALRHAVVVSAPVPLPL